MASPIAAVFDKLGGILGVCPCCTNLFYLSETRPFLDGRKQKSVIDTLRAAEIKLSREEEKLSEAEERLRLVAAKAGLRAAKKILKKIDTTFSGAGHDPHDVKVLFDPVPYIVFSGMSNKSVRGITFLAKPPPSGAVEKIHRSIDGAIRKGNYDFRTIRVSNDGTIETK
ncbi:MAG: Holliday junction resolvase-like protein [Pseudomonadota bacterium]